MAPMATPPRMPSYAQDSPAPASNDHYLNGAGEPLAADADMEGAPDTDEFQSSDDHDREVSFRKSRAVPPFCGVATVAVKKKVKGAG